MANCFPSRMPDGWRSPADLCWDLWVSGDLVATVTRYGRTWHGYYYGEDKPDRSFVGRAENPHGVMEQIEDYITG